MNGLNLRPILTIVCVCALAMTFVACGDETQPLATSTPPAPTSTPPRATQTPSLPDGVGIDVVDSVVAAIAADDRAAFVQLIQPQHVACGNVQGLGGPPDCGAAPGNPPEGTIVEVFPFLTCEREWQFDLDQFAGRWFELVGELYAVVRLDLPASDVLPPDGQYGIIYANVDPSIETAHALILNEGSIVAADSLCGGFPDRFLQDVPPFYGPEVIAEGPAFNE